MMLKKYLVLLVLGFTLNLAFGQSEPARITLTPSSQTVYHNQLASVDVGVQGVVGLFAISVTLSFENTIIKCLNITQGNFLASNGGGYNVFFETFPEDLYSASTVTVDQSILGPASVTGTGNIFTITFEPFAGGTSEIEVTSFSLRDINNQEIPATVESAVINVNPVDAAVITLNPSSQTVYLNQLASVTVGIEGVENLFAISITLLFNNSIIKCSSITQGNFLAGNSGGYNVLFQTFPEDLYSASSVTVDQSILGLAAVSGTGDLFTITFEPFAGGTSEIEVISFSLRDINNQEIPATAQSAEIEVIPLVAAVITLTPSTQTVLSNTPVSVVVGVEGVVGLFAVSVTLSFDNSIIKCLNITQGNFLASNEEGYGVYFGTFPEDLYLASTVTVDQSILGLATVSGTGNIFTITFEPFAGDTSEIEVTSFSLRDINNQEIPTIAETAEITVNASVVNSKIFLQGPYNTGVMQTTLNSSGILPLTQPYSSAPWNYSGPESVAAGFFSTHTDIVDWVLVELRTGISAGTTVARRAALLKSDGSIVDINGAGPVRFFALPAAGYYIVVKHRNHLAIMSSAMVSISGITLLYDFTDSQTKAYGTNAMFNLGGVYGMYSADANGNGQVQNNDSEEYWAPQNGLPGYRGPDFNLNGQVQNNDRESYWVPNNGKGTQVPN